LQNEYEKLVSGLQQANEAREDEDMMASPGEQFEQNRVLKFAVLSKDMLDEAVPGNIRKAEHFVAFLKRFIEYLKVSFTNIPHLPRLSFSQTRMRVLHVVAETPQSFLAHLKEITYIERRPLKLVLPVSTRTY